MDSVHSVFKPCKVDWCKANSHYRAKGKRGYCNRHYLQLVNFGKITITRYDRNKYEIRKDYGVIFASYKDETYEVIVDKEEMQRLIKYKWTVITGYAHNHSLGRMHRLILKAPKSAQVHHVNGNKIDNRKSNLKLIHISDHSQLHGIEMGLKSNNSSGFKGVSFHKAAKKWSAYVNLNKKRHYLGLFNCPIEAAKAYDEKALELFGERAVTNKSLGLY